jgi:L-asparaginase
MTRYEFGGGIVSSDSIYVERHLDAELFETLRQRRNLVVVTAPRQSGKSSFLNRLLASLREAGQRTAYIDLRIAIGAPQDVNTKAVDWFRLFFEAVAADFGLDSSGVSEWMLSRQKVPWARQVIEFLTTYCRESLSGPLVIAVDEIDFVSLFGYHTDSLFEALRSLASERRLDISFILASVNHPSDLLKALSRATFNVFLARQLYDFEADAPTVSKWSAGLEGWPEKTKQAVGREVLRQTGGQPFLSSVLFQKVLETDAKSVEAVQQLADQMAGEKDAPQLRAHFLAPQDIILHDESRAWEALDLYGKALQEPIVTGPVRRPVVNLLVSAGLVREKEGKIAAKSPIYARAFDGDWIDECKKRIGLTHLQLKAPLLRKESADTVCVINTGGMISMELKPGGEIDAPVDLRAFFNDFPEMREIANIDTLALMSKDSSNMAPGDWREIAEAIYQRRNRGFRGFVVCHGTDTLAYTASAVAFALGPGLKVPVVFTAAQVPRHILHGDARINILRACKVATLEIPEVVVSIGDHVYRAVRAEKKDDYRFDAFHSPTMPPLATIAPEIELQKQLIRAPDRSRGMECVAEFSQGVFKVTFYPGLNPAFLKPILENPIMRGLIIETPGIGVLPTEDEYSLTGLIERATEKSIPVLLVSQYPIQARLSRIYSFATPPIKAGAIPAINMSAPAAVTKFMWVLPQVEKKIESGDILAEEKLNEIADYMSRNLIGELNE